MMDLQNSTSSPDALPPEIYTYAERVFVASVVVLVVICGSIGNTAVILAVAFSRKLQNSTYVFVTNLAVCDLLTCLFLPWSAVALFARNGWPLPRAEWLCSAAAFMVFACVITSMFNLAAIAFNRYILVCHTFETFTKTFSTRNIYIIVCTSWLVPFTVVFALPVAGIGRLGYDRYGGGGCTDIDTSPGAELYQWVQVGLSSLPITAIVICYILIFIHVKRHFKKQERTIKHTAQHMISMDPSVSMDLDHDKEPEKTPNHNSSNHATTYTSTANSKRHRKYSPNPSKMATTSTNISITTSDLSNESASDLKNGGLPDTYSTTNRRQRKLRRQQLQVTGRLFLIVCAFFICITPYCIAIAIPGIPQRWIIYTSLLTIINSSINPAIYSLTHPHFKEFFIAMLRCRFSDIPQPSDTLRRFLNN